MFHHEKLKKVVVSISSNFHWNRGCLASCGAVPIVIWDYVHGELAVTFNEQTWPILKNLACNKDQNNAKNW
jgi:hypothetical protein